MVLSISDLKHWFCHPTYMYVCLTCVLIENKMSKVYVILLLYTTAGYIWSILWEEVDTECGQTVICFHGDQCTVEQRSASATEAH